MNTIFITFLCTFTMYVLGNPFPKPENDVHFHINMPKQQSKAKQKEHGEEYSMKIGNNVMRSKFDTAPEHPVEVKGSVLNSNFHNYRDSTGRSVDVVDDDEEETLLDNQGLGVGGHVLNSKMWTA